MPAVLPLAAPAGFPFRTSVGRHDSAPLHPGEVLREQYLPHWRLDAVQLAVRTGIDHDVINTLLAEKVAMTPELAGRFADAFAVSARFWLALQMQYDLWHALTGARET